MTTPALLRIVATVVALHLLLASAPTAAATLVVSTQDDNIVLNGDCTLREALIAANTDIAQDGCPAGAGEDIIVLPGGIYLLSLTGPGENGGETGDLDVNSAVVIRGAGVEATILDGGSFDYPFSDRVIDILPGGRVGLTGLTVQGGVCANGGGILNAGQLLVLESRIRANAVTTDADLCGVYEGGAGIHNVGQLVVTRSTLSGNVETSSGEELKGGALLNSGRATIRESVLTGNFAAVGGGIYNDGTLRVIDTTLSANGARFYGGPLLNEGTALLERTTVRDNGETIMHMAGDGVLTLLNSTVSGNQSFRIAGSVINWGTTPINIVSSTIADNTDSTGREAGINGISGSVRLMNTIVANPEGRNCVGQVTSLGYNLDSDGSCGLNAVGDLPSSDPLLGPLADHGGPTWTHALLVGSPAIDRIPTKLCSVRTDQRGVERPQPRKGLCDIGSYELER